MAVNRVKNVHTAENIDVDGVYFIIDPKDTNYINRILEGYEYLGVMTTLVPQKGLIMVRTTADTQKLTQSVLLSLDKVHSILSLEEARTYLVQNT